MTIRVVDSHTEGEPTRVVLSGGPDLGSGPLAERARRFREEFDRFRSMVVEEPRGFDALVGALLCPPSAPDCATGVIYFNNVGLLGMCGHATIGLAVTLAHLGRIGPGRHRFETPVGVVSVELEAANRVSVENVESYRLHKDLTLEVEGLGEVIGDVAWGGNWFFLTESLPVDLSYGNRMALTEQALAIRRALTARGITGAGGAEIDHIEIAGPARGEGADARNFVLCPGGAFDRSPCGTGTSAKLACLAADGLLAPGVSWTQESILGSRYGASYQPGSEGGVIVTLSGRAFVVAEASLIRSPEDPFIDGFGPALGAAGA